MLHELWWSCEKFESFLSSFIRKVGVDIFFVRKWWVPDTSRQVWTIWSRIPMVPCFFSPILSGRRIEAMKSHELLYFEWSPPWHFKTARLDFMSAWSGQVRVDIQLISWNAFCYSQLRRLTGSNLLSFFLTYLLTYLLTFLLTYLLTFFLTYLLKFFLTYLLTFFLTYLLTFFLTYLPIFFLTYLLTFFPTYLLTCFLTYLLTFFLTFFLTYQRQNIASTVSHKSHSTNSTFTSHQAAKVISMTTLCLSNGNSTVTFDCIGPPRQKAVKSKDAKRL